MGCTLRGLSSKCACLHALESIPNLLAPHQLGFGITAGAEAAIHAGRVYIDHLPPDKALIKLDFKNALNSIRRDKLLEAVKTYIPDLLPYMHSAYSSPSILLWDDVQLSSAEGIQQGDPLGPMLFCLGIHNLVSSLSSELNVFYLDDGTIGCDLWGIQEDLARIENAGKSLGLVLNISKSEVISHNKSSVSSLLSSLPDLQFIAIEHAQLLGSPLGSAAMHLCLQEQLHRLELIGERLSHLSMHDAITILRHSFSIPKLLYILRTSPAFSSSSLESWDNLLRSIVSRIINIRFEQDDSSWCQASLPINHGGLGFRSCSSLAPSADGASELMQKLLPPHLQTATYLSKDRALTAWKDALPANTPLPNNMKHQKSWDLPIIQLHLHSLLTRCVD